MPYRDPEVQKVAKREWARRQRVVEPQRGTHTLGPLLPVEFRVRTARDVVSLIESQVAAILVDQAISTPERARVVGYLAGIALRAIEAGDVEARLEAVEQILKLRKMNAA